MRSLCLSLSLWHIPRNKNTLVSLAVNPLPGASSNAPADLGGGVGGSWWGPVRAGDRCIEEP